MVERIIEVAILNGNDSRCTNQGMPLMTDEVIRCDQLFSTSEFVCCFFPATEINRFHLQTEGINYNARISTIYFYTIKRYLRP